MKSKLSHAPEVKLPVQLKEVVQARVKSCVYRDGNQNFRGSQKKSFRKYILESN